MRWVSDAKQQLGLRAMQEVLDVYRLSGHLPPAVDKAIFQLAQLSMMPEESETSRSPHDRLIDAVLSLHGIVYGSRRWPSAPAVEFDPLESRVWDGFPEQASEQPYNEAPVGEDPQSRQGDWATPEAAASVTVPPRQQASTADSPIQDPSEGYQEALSAFGSAMLSAEKLKTELRTGAVESPASIDSSDRQANAVGPTTAPVAVRETGDLPEPNQTREAANGAGGDPLWPTIRASLTELAEQEWRLVETLIPPVKPGGRPSKYDRREILNGIVYQTRTGCSWRTLAKDLPPWKIVHHYFRTWRKSGQLGRIISELETPKWESTTGSNGSTPHPSRATPSGPADGQGAGECPRTEV